ncbi:MAG: carboxy terminal-processing peptidase [Gammaproteobacteria bacterium]|nr:carboxy terminal-processing peptidase [Gammaproteobacteria bacterium]NND40248.1 carboxy terminal-processing peptidase [Pseudomonadales bacterium]NNL10157.1 carboxy terminal-processing peptidase [Pseudomonadales bacterium]NNM10847.1 carboxy terminal-processing peptidase [Pseudomonadales bacterium]
MVLTRNKVLLPIAAALLFSVAALALVSPEREQAVEANDTTPLQPQIRHARTAEEILIKLQRRHYEKRQFDDSLSSLLLDTYLENLDPNKNYFSREDIAAFEPYRFELDDGLRRGNLKPSYKIFNRYRELAISYIEHTQKNLPELIAGLDFERDEHIQLNSEEQDWPANNAERDDRRRKSLKNAVLSLRLAEKDDDEIVETLQKRFRNQVTRLRQFNAEDVFQTYMNALVSLYDPHSNYMSPRTSENFSINMSLSLEGIGAVLSSDGDYTVVERLVKGGPAELQGELKPKHRIIAVGQGRDSEVENVVGWRLDEVVELIRGRKNTVVKLEIQGQDAGSQLESKFIHIVRNKVKLEEQAAQSDTLDVYYNGQLKKIGVVQVPTFYHDYEAQMRGEKNFRSTTRDVQKLLKQLDEEQVEGVVIDLRGNGGGYLEEARTLTGLFVERGPVVQIRMANGKIKPEGNYPNPDHYDKPIIVLIDRLSASASEIFAGAIQDYGRGLVVGSQSFGKGTVQQVTPLNHGALKLTEAKYYRISGESTQHRGVLPDIVLPSLYDGSEIGENTLDRALGWDKVKPLRHRVYGDFSPLVNSLQQEHAARVGDDPDYRYLVDKISLNDKYKAITDLPLSLSKRKAMIEADESDREALERALRVAKGLPAEPEEEPADNAGDDNKTLASVDVDKQEAGSDEQDPRSDFLLNEAASILLDAISLANGESIVKSRVAANENIVKESSAN